MDAETPSPLSALERAIQRGNQPLIEAVNLLRLTIHQHMGALRASTDTRTPIEDVPVHKPWPGAKIPEAELDPKVFHPFDMETAIKAAKKWECGELHCRNCVDKGPLKDNSRLQLTQNLACLKEYKIDFPEVGPLHKQETPCP